ncbi:MAG: zinc ABC transporter substrate-binding protein [Thermoplasmata archaeon]
MKNKMIIASIVILLVMSVLSTGCIDDDDGEYDLRVAVTIPPQREWVEEIGGNGIKVTVMVPPGSDPHIYEPTSSQMVDVSEADIYFKVGAGMEFEKRWMDTLIEYNEEMVIIDGSKGVPLLDYDHEEHENDHEGDDPHIWLSPVNAKIMINNLLNALTEVDPDNSDIYNENAADYLDRLDSLHEDVEESLHPYHERKFLIYHPSLNYFAHEYGLIQIGVEREGQEPGASGLEAVIEQAKEENIRVVFVSPQFDESNARTIADEIDGEVITLNPLAENYIENIEDITNKLGEAFGE